MTILIPALAAVGVLLLYSGLTSPARGNRVGARIARSLAEAGLPLTPAHVVTASVVGACAAFLLVAGVTKTAVAGGVAAGAAGWAPFAYVRTRRDRRREALREAWPDAIAAMVAGIRAGVSLPEVCTSLAERGPHELRRAFATFAATYRATGSFEAAILRLRTHVADPIADRVAVSLSLAQEVGGTDLVRVLRTLGDFVREDLRIRKEIRARWSWTITAARVAAASPWVVLLLMSTQPEAAAAYSSSGGGAVLLFGAVATFVGYRAMLRAGRLPQDERLS